MKSRWIVNLLLLVAIIVLSYIGYYQPGIEEAPAARTISDLQRTEITHINIRRAARDDLKLNKQGQLWSIEADVELPADFLQVSSLTKMAEQKAERYYPAAELDLTQIELDPPNATVMLNDTALDFGGLESLEGLRYVRSNDHVYLIPDLYQHLIDASYTNFVRRRLFADNARIKSITLPNLEIKRVDGDWKIEPEQAISADSLQQFIEQWQNATALIVQKAEPVSGEDSVTIGFEQTEQSVTLGIQSQQPELVLSRPELGVQYKLGNRSSVFIELPEEPVDTVDPETDQTTTPQLNN